ncbi:MAG: hypothetical protein AAGB04_14355 [Pseudomonadota bacterium]
MPWRSLFLFCFLAAGLTCSHAVAGNKWVAKEIDRGTLPSEIIKETRPLAKNSLPDGLRVKAVGTVDIAAAWYTRPTLRYGHAILGDATEAGGLMLKTVAGETVELVLPKTNVFEDRYPRLVDLDNDGTTEVVTIRASLSAGGSVTVYSLKQGKIEQRGSTGFIGLSNRWLNVAGIADFRGTGRKQIAYVETPHIGGTLYFYELADGKLKRIAGLLGFSNHVIGSPEMRLSGIADVNADGRPDLAVPSANRRSLRIVGFVGKGLSELGRASLPGRIDKAILVRTLAGRPSFVVGLDNGRVFEIRKP